jgi:hypothetical protein
VLTNDDVVKMVKAGLSESLIRGQIQSAAVRFDLSTNELIRLSKDGVPESILTVMRAASAPGRVAGAAAVAHTIKTPDGERVQLTLMEDLSSATANEGDRVSFTVAEDLKVGDVVIVAKGASAFGSVKEAKKKGMLGRGGKLSISLDQVKAVDGQNVRVRATSGREGDDKLGKTVAIGVLAGPFALLVKGKDVTATKGTEYSAYIDETKDIALGGQNTR